MVTFAASACLAGFGLFRAALVQNMGVVAIVFGCIGMQAPLFQMWSFVRKPTDRLFWWYTHLGNFLASYVAAWTAFSVTTLVQLLHNGAWYVRLWPTIVGSPAIALTTVYYKWNLHRGQRHSRQLRSVQIGYRRSGATAGKLRVPGCFRAASHSAARTAPSLKACRVALSCVSDSFALRSASTCSPAASPSRTSRRRERTAALWRPPQKRGAPAAVDRESQGHHSGGFLPLPWTPAR